nr:peptidase M22 [Clostridiales bacterium]
SGDVCQYKKLLPVKEGEKGIRQSDAVFHHTNQLTELFDKAFADFNGKLSAVGVSVKPCNIEGSYMPCFLPGIMSAQSVSSALKIPLYKFSHQDGHIAAALYSAGRLDLINHDFIAFHISGGTSQALKVSPGKGYFNTSLIADSLDLKAGQAVDRVGLMLGLYFPCGPELDKLAQKSKKNYSDLKVYRKDGNFSLSGVENKCKDMLNKGEKAEDIALYCIKYIEKALYDTVIEVKTLYGDLPLVFSGGVMSNSIIRKDFTERFNAYFAEAQYSADNAAGVAILASVLNGD